MVLSFHGPRLGFSGTENPVTGMEWMCFFVAHRGYGRREHICSIVYYRFWTIGTSGYPLNLHVFRACAVLFRGVCTAMHLLVTPRQRRCDKGYPPYRTPGLSPPGQVLFLQLHC